MKKFFVLQAILSVLLLVGNGIMYLKLPGRIPVFWEADGYVSATGPKWLVFVLPVILLLAAIFFSRIVTKAQKVNENKEVFSVSQGLLLVIVFAAAFAVATGLSVYYFTAYFL